MLSDRSWQAPDAARVLIDTSIWIYHFEQNPEYARAAAQVIERLEDGKFRGIASELTLLELTVRPLQLGRQECRGHRAMGPRHQGGGHQGRIAALAIGTEGANP